MPWHCSANSRGAAIPATVRRCAAWSATAPRHYTTHSRTAGAPRPKKGWRNPRRDNAQLFCTRAGWRRDVRPVGAVTTAAIGPVRPSRPLHHHARRCGTCGDGTPPRQPPCLVWPPVNGTLESPRGRPSNEQPQRHPPSKPFLYGHRTRRDTPPEAGFSRTIVYSVALYVMPLHVGGIVWHTCKLLPPWPIKGGAVP
jgi:hypothetical protein